MSKLFINPDDNIFFSKLRGLDLQELIFQTENYFLEYRDNLNLPNDVTIGIEIEYEDALRFFTDRFVHKNLPLWRSKRDASLNLGGEVTSPVMRDEKRYWQELKMVCDYLSKRKVDTFHNAGGHVHIGAPVLGDDVQAWRVFLKFYILYECVLFRFGYGDKINGRRKIIKYASPVADTFYRKLNMINRAMNMMDIRGAVATNDRYVALNFENVHFYNLDESDIKNTIEFRGPNASTEAVVLQNNVNTFSKMLLSAKMGVIDEEFLDYKLLREHLPYSGNEYLYNDVCLKNALEYVDLVFDNNLDKIYFLRQYLKGLEERYVMRDAVRAKKFVK